VSEPGQDQESLLRALHEHGDRAARDRLVEENMPLARAIARRYAGRGEPLEDLVQIATIGLIKAIDRFDVERGVRLESYAVPTMVGEIKRHFRDRAWALHVPRRLKELNLKLVTLIEELTVTLERSPTVAELATAADVEAEEVLEALESGEARTALSLSAPIGDDPDAQLIDTLGGDPAEFEHADDRALVVEGLTRLAPRERKIVYLRFFEGLSQSQIATEVGISQMQVSRLLRRSLEELRHEIEDGY
jgi:RNA polymerase sigma-B factor